MLSIQEAGIKPLLWEKGIFSSLPSEAAWPEHVQFSISSPPARQHMRWQRHSISVYPQAMGLASPRLFQSVQTAPVMGAEFVVMDWAGSILLGMWPREGRC